MRITQIGKILCFLGFTASVAVAGVDTSPRPVARPDAAHVTEPVVTDAKSDATIRQSLRPKSRPSTAEKKAAKQIQAIKRGQVCADARIQGKALGTVAHPNRGCGVSDAVRVTSVSGVKLSQAATLDCKTAKSLANWMDKSAKPAIGTKGGGLASISVMGHYACRPRNNQKGAKISEHGRGRAIDIGAFKLKDGQSFSVLKDWRSAKWSKTLKKMHQGACGPFGTVLGPNANRFHQDHFHFDTARYRSGSYCR